VVVVGVVVGVVVVVVVPVSVVVVRVVAVRVVSVRVVVTVVPVVVVVVVVVVVDVVVGAGVVGISVVVIASVVRSSVVGAVVRSHPPKSPPSINSNMPWFNALATAPHPEGVDTARYAPSTQNTVLLLLLLPAAFVCSVRASTLLSASAVACICCDGIQGNTRHRSDGRD
jgi:hypothetical protein